MASRLKEDERNERSIRSLLKLPQNRRCINCNSLGPQYVCTNFWTFVCTTCSGIHREFTHRVKSVSMAKFTSQEVSALQGGGNASAREIYFKEWDAAHQSLPDSSNVERLRDFIRLVYVNRRYTGEKSFDKPPRVKMGEADNSYQGGGSRSPPFENERRYGERSTPGGRSDDRGFTDSYDERRSPGYDQDFSRSLPDARKETVNDWRREDRFRDGKRAEDGKIPDGGGSKVESKSPDRQKDPDMSSPPIVRPVRDILGEKVSPLRIIGPPKVDGPRPADGSLRTQRTVSSSGLTSSNGNPAELRTESSLIDFDTVPEPPSTAPVPQIQQTASSPAPFVTQPTTSTNNNWANFDSAQEVKASHAPPSTNFLDVLSELSVPASSHGGSSFPSNATPVAAPSTNVQLSSFGTAVPVAGPISHSTVAPGGAQGATPGHNAFFNTADGGWWQNRLPVIGNQAPAQSFNQAVGGSQNNQPWNPSLSGNSQGAQSQVTHGVDGKPTPKTELPVDLFTSNYSSFAGPGPGWFPAPHPQYGMGFNMHYNVPGPMPPAFLQPSTPSNPFDVNQSSQVQATTFPSMAPLQGALPNIYRTSSLGTLPPAFMPTQTLPSNIQRTSSLGNNPSQASHHQLPMSTQVPSYGSPMPSGPLMGTAAPRPQVGGFGTLNVGQQQSGSSFSSNPFG